MRLATLRRRAEFLAVHGGSRWSSASFVMEAKPRPAPDPSAPSRPECEAGARFGFTITKKVGGAVERNRIRRRLKHALVGLVAEHARAGTDYVVVARRTALDRDFADLTAELRLALERVHRPPRPTPPARPTPAHRPQPPTSPRER